MRFVSAFVLLSILFCPALRGAAPNDPAAEKGAQPGLGQDSVTVDPQTEEIIRGALRYLASKQTVNGSWQTGGENQTLAMTGYTLIGFLAAGQLPDEGEFGKNVTAGMQFILNSVRTDGTMGSYGHYMYGHGIASIALAEIYGQTRDPRVRQKLDQIIKLIIRCQNHEGGWRYMPTAADADMSVTVLQLVALRAAKNSGIEVPQATIDRGVKYVRTCYHKGSGGFCYQPFGGNPGFARTAAAIYSLQVCGEYTDPRMATGSKFLFDRKSNHQWFTYGNFYAAPAQYMIGGETWQKWYTLMRNELVPKAKREGNQYHWDTEFDGGRGVGPVFCTAVYTTILAMPYHYLPLYQR